MSHLTGKVAIVTGSSRGIGRAAALRLGGLGATVVVNYLTSSAQADQVVSEISYTGARAVAIRADISDRTQLESLFQQTRDMFGRVDVVVANAGIDFGVGPVVDITEIEFDRVFTAHARGGFFTLQTAARFIESDGAIVYVGSAATLAPTVGFGLYASSKLPGNYLVGVLARELGPRGVRVNAVLPTAVDGAGYFAADEAGDELRAALQHASPLGSRMGTTADVADAIEYLTGPLSEWVSGQQIVVSGGLM